VSFSKCHFVNKRLEKNNLKVV